MKIGLYNQLLDKYSSQWCIAYWQAHIFLLDYYIQVENNFLLNTLKSWEALSIWSSKEWGRFDKLYNQTKTTIEEKLWLNFSIKVCNVDWLVKGTCYGLWIIKFNRDTINAFSDWVLTKQEIKDFIKSTKWSWHHLVWKNWYLIDSYTSKVIKCSQDALRQLINMWAIWNTFRTFKPENNYTLKITNYCKDLWKVEKMWKQFLIKYIEKWHEVKSFYFKKALDLYFYWRTDRLKYDR